jgi:RND family efflux transporter MFP subunit
MSPEPENTPKRGRLLLVGLAALVIAGIVAAVGIMQRSQSNREVAQWTDKQAIPTVGLAKLATDDAVRDLMLPGTIQAYYRAAIYARVSGYLKGWQEDIGAQVKAGQVLATIDVPDLDQQYAQAKADLATATANANVAALTSGRWNILVKQKWVSQQAADDKTAAAAATKAAMEAASANVKRLEAMESFKNIVAPFDGLVTARKTDIGALINAGNAGQELFEVSDLHKIRIYVRVPQTYSAEIQPNLTAMIAVPQYPDQQFEATVATTSHAMDESSRTMLVELQADNADGKLFAGAYCRVYFKLPGNPNAMRVPATALIAADHGMQVAILGNDSKAILKPIKLGRDFGDNVEVLSGISPSDKVIDSPPETLRNGDEVQLAATPQPSNEVAAGAASTNKQ